jgi:hypothetical protein
LTLDGRHARTTIAVVGTGGLSRAVCYSLAAMSPAGGMATVGTVGSAPGHVVVIGRSLDKARQLCFVANARAALSGRAVTFEPFAGEPETVLSTVRVAGVLVCASSQSPWERLTRPSAWTDLMDRAGFGLTLPFQAELAARVGRAVAALDPRPWLVNACFPDAVNPLLAALGVPVLCGVGNIALLAASAQAALELPDQRRLRMLAHHVHLHAPAAGEPEALGWLDGEPVDVAALLAGQRAAERTELNQVTGHATALLLADLVGGTETATHLPGPLGLPGGYPVTVRGTDLALRLPVGMSRDDAIAFNQRAALADGIVVDGDRIRFGPAAIAELEHLAPALSNGFPVTELPSATAELQALRTRLRAQPRARLAEQETQL